MLNYKLLLFCKRYNSCSIGLALRINIKKFNPFRGLNEWDQQDLETFGQNRYSYFYTEDKIHKT